MINLPKIGPYTLLYEDETSGRWFRKTKYQSFDDDILRKVKTPRPDLKEFFNHESTELSEGVLSLLGFLPGDWLLSPNDKGVRTNLQYELEIYEKAKDSIRGRKLDARFEGILYYVRPLELAQWFRDKKIPIDKVVNDFLICYFTPQKKKRGRPSDSWEIVQQIASYFKAQGITVLSTTGPLKDNEQIRPLVEKYLEGKREGQIKKRYETLRNNINKILSKSS